eukprot:513837-Prorocentrum_minimum.AAC.1
MACGWLPNHLLLCRLTSPPGGAICLLCHCARSLLKYMPINLESGYLTPASRHSATTGILPRSSCAGRQTRKVGITLKVSAKRPLRLQGFSPFGAPGSSDFGNRNPDYRIRRTVGLAWQAPTPKSTRHGH